jgi:hypothetical protein
MKSVGSHADFKRKDKIQNLNNSIQQRIFGLHKNTAQDLPIHQLQNIETVV